MINLNENQRKSVFEPKGNILVSASPGAGKTRSLVARALYKIEKLPELKTIALITYTNAAADEIASRIVSEKNVFIGTIHLFCLKFILRPFSWIYKWNNPKILGYEEQQVFFEENPDIDLGPNNLDELNKIRKKINGELDLDVEWNHSLDLNSVASRYYEYQNKINVIDFNEILYRSYKIIKENKFVAKSLSCKFFEILIDEFQDTSLFQYEILRIINESGSCSFFMVGDEKQKIFRFAGAIDKAFEQANKDFKSKSNSLTKTYRSTNNIVKAYSSLFDNHPIIENKSEHKDLDIKIFTLKTKKDNHQQTLKNIIDHLIKKANCALTDIAILSTRWTDALNASKAIRKEYDVVGLGALPHSTRNLSNSTFFLLRYLAKYMWLPNIRTLRTIKRNIDIHLLENNLSFSDEQLSMKTNLLISNFGEIDISKPIEEGLNMCKEIFDKTFEVNHSSFDDIIERIIDDEKESWDLKKYLKALSGVKGITSNTIHQAKGLEFEVVILNQINEGRIPYQKWNPRNREYEALTINDMEDGRNLFYVAISRAKKCQYILHNWKPSLFIKKIKEE